MGLKRELSAWEKIKDDNDDLENEEKVKFDNHGDDPPVLFSFLNEQVWLEREYIDQVPCHFTHTNDQVNQIILDNMHQNRNVTEEVTGPRYCPCLEIWIQKA